MPIYRSNKKIVAITMGDPSGIGPEVILKALCDFKNKSAFFLIIGDFKFLRNLNRRLSLGLKLSCIKSEIDLLDGSGIGVLDLENVKNIKSERNNGKASIQYIDKFLELYKKGLTSILVTGPVSKESIKLIRPSFMGHTEYLAAKTNTKDYAMMFAGGPRPTNGRSGGRFDVVLLTTHIPLKDVPKNISKKMIFSKVKIINSFFKKYYKKLKPVIGIAGLNPHCGEGGKIGREEKSVIKPSCEALRKKGFNVIGPLSSEALFYDAYRGKFDIILCMYHDQGLTPLKMIARDKLVNVTLGLPFTRTSPAHGTGFDIRNKFIADPGSMKQAINLAIKLS